LIESRQRREITAAKMREGVICRTHNILDNLPPSDHIVPESKIVFRLDSLSLPTQR
jgi:hypothetical protein